MDMAVAGETRTSPAFSFSIAMDPAVTWLHTRRGWSRGRASGMVFLVVVVPVVLLITALIPALVTLGIEGVWQALVLVAWTAVFQQIEDYWLSPKPSAQSMEINGGVALGSALAGGAITGPMGAFMAMPVAALVTSFVKDYVPRDPLAYRCAYDPDETDTPVAAPLVAMQAALA